MAIGRSVGRNRTTVSEFCREARKHVFDNLKPTRKEGMGVFALWHTFSVFRALGEVIAINYCDLFAEIAQNPGSEETCHAATDNERLSSWHLHAKTTPPHFCFNGRYYCKPHR